MRSSRIDNFWSSMISEDELSILQALTKRELSERLVDCQIRANIINSPYDRDDVVRYIQRRNRKQDLIESIIMLTLSIDDDIIDD